MTHYKNGEEVKYWGYWDIHALLKEYDEDLAALFLSINVNYPALLADIGRFIILFRYGGVYHDLKFISNLSMIKYLNSLPLISFIGETNPIDPTNIRSGNIAVLTKGHALFKNVLSDIKKKLLVAKEERWFGSKLMVSIGSRIFKNVFNIYKSEIIIKYPLEKKRLVIFNNIIYRKNVRSWQKTEEFIF
jgi:mannosyltransferase OCH1-like enzyme